VTISIPHLINLIEFLSDIGNPFFTVVNLHAYIACAFHVQPAFLIDIHIFLIGFEDLRYLETGLLFLDGFILLDEAGLPGCLDSIRVLFVVE
jgi:hypothetical protein